MISHQSKENKLQGGRCENKDVCAAVISLLILNLCHFWTQLIAIANTKIPIKPIDGDFHYTNFAAISKLHWRLCRIIWMLAQERCRLGPSIDSYYRKLVVLIFFTGKTTRRAWSSKKLSILLLELLTKEGLKKSRSGRKRAVYNTRHGKKTYKKISAFFLVQERTWNRLFRSTDIQHRLTTTSKHKAGFS